MGRQTVADNLAAVQAVLDEQQIEYAVLPTRETYKPRIVIPVDAIPTLLDVLRQSERSGRLDPHAVWRFEISHQRRPIDSLTLGNDFLVNLNRSP